MRILGRLAVVGIGFLWACEEQSNAPSGASTRLSADVPKPKGGKKCDSPSEQSKGVPEAPEWLKDGTTIVRYSVSMGAPPPFYKKGSKLEYVIGEAPGRGSIFGRPTPFFYEFPTFRTEFIIRKGDVVGARTISKDGQLKAKVSDINFSAKKLPNGYYAQAMEIREHHYDAAGTVIFEAWSEINASTGFKVSERDACGEKADEYYFVWPALR